jgi:4-methylaminobutanoate oxidase (formaldehyde-forming)
LTEQIFPSSIPTQAQVVIIGGVFGCSVAYHLTIQEIDNGYALVNALRMEKYYREYDHDIDNLDTPREAGLGYFVPRHFFF